MISGILIEAAALALLAPIGGTAVVGAAIFYHSVLEHRRLALGPRELKELRELGELQVSGAALHSCPLAPSVPLVPSAPSLPQKPPLPSGSTWRVPQLVRL